MTTPLMKAMKELDPNAISEHELYNLPANDKDKEKLNTFEDWL